MKDLGDYVCEGQMDIFGFLDDAPKPYKITKPIRLIELFAGIGAQAEALKRLTNFEHYKISEWEVHACASYHKMHMRDDKTDYSAAYTDKELIDLIDNIGVSVDGKKPLSRTKLKSRGEKWHRKVYNDFIATHNLGSITNLGGDDLGIIDTDKYTYILTYSFPCQDLSVAGKQKGMSKGSGTRSGLLWEVERILHECKELPEILLMENVPNVHGKANIADFKSWIKSLEDLGYTNFWQDLNAKNYGVAQNRNRTFMVSILKSNVTYSFPKPFPLTKTMKDYLEDEVDEKYYINSEKAKQLIDKLIENGTLADRQTDRQWTSHLKTLEQHQSQMQLSANMMQESQTERTKEAVLQNIEKYGNKNSNYVPFDAAVSYPLHSQDFVRTGFLEIAPTISSRDYKDPKIVTEKVITAGNINPSGNGINDEVIAAEGIARTITTNKGEGQKILVKDE